VRNTGCPWNKPDIPLTSRRNSPLTIEGLKFWAILDSFHSLSKLQHLIHCQDYSSLYSMSTEWTSELWDKLSGLGKGGKSTWVLYYGVCTVTIYCYWVWLGKQEKSIWVLYYRVCTITIYYNWVCFDIV